MKNINQDPLQEQSQEPRQEPLQGSLQQPVQKKQLNKYARFSGIAFQMIAIIALGTFGGVKLDEIYPNTYSLYTVSLSLLSVLISLFYVVKQVLKMGSKN